MVKTSIVKMIRVHGNFLLTTGYKNVLILERGDNRKCSELTLEH